MSTNQAFLKAFRRDRPNPLGPTTRVRRQAAVHELAPWQNSVEIVAPNFTSLATAGRPVLAATSTGPTIGKRPLSSFAPASTAEPPVVAEPVFRPETTISAFRWPHTCRALWEQYADQYERVADLLIQRAVREPSRGGIIGVCGLHAGDGCTTTLLCLSVALAARRTQAILVDANFRAPRMASLLGAEPTTTWQDVLQQGLPVAEAVIRAENDHLDLLPLDARDLGGHEPSGTKLAAGLQSAITAGVLRYAYELVLVDLGAVLAPRSYATIAALARNMRVDAVLVVVDPKHAERDDLAVAGELVEECGCELLGIIENRSAKPQVANPNFI